MAAGWPDDNLLAGGLGAAGWLAGRPQGPQDPDRGHGQEKVIVSSTGPHSNLFARLQHLEYYKMKAPRLHGLHCCKAVRLHRLYC